MSNLKVNTINDAAGGSSAVLYGVASPPNSMGFRNRIINGEMRIDQRNAGASVTQTTGLVYPVDRFATNGSVTSKFTAQRSTVAPAGFINSLLITSSAATSLAATDYYLLRQAIEGFNTADFAFGSAGAQSVTMSFWVRSSLTGTFGGSLLNASANRCYAFSYSISAANTWEYKTVTIAGDTTGTWATDNTVGLYVDWSLGAGASVVGTAGSWGSTVLRAPTGQTSVVGTSGATFYITGVQLEAGSVASPFERRDYGRELLMCQRYYEKSFSQDVVPSNGPSATALSTTNGSVTGLASNVLNTGPTVNFKVTKRAAPTMSKFGNNSGDWVYALQNSAAWVAGASSGVGRISDSSFTVDQQAVDKTGVFVMGHWVATAEL